jgi:gliding motility-associated-like protein
VYSLPVIVAQPKSYTSVLVDDVIEPLFLIPDSSKSKVSYKWFVSNNSSFLSSDSIPGANTTSYKPSTHTPGKFYYYCQLTTDSGACKILTEPALVEVIPHILTVDADLIDLTCKNFDNGSIIVHISGGSYFKKSSIPYNVILTKKGSFPLQKPTGLHTSIDSVISVGRTTMVYTDTISNLAEGDYELTVIDSLSTKLTKTYSLKAPAPISAIGKVKQISSKSRQSGEISISLSGGTPPYSFTWSKDHQPKADTTLVLVDLSSGYYTFTVTDANLCSSVVLNFRIEEDMAINTFSPNGDGTNDLFFQNYFLQVFSRNGILLYEGTSGWDGTFNNQPVQEDTYMYVVRIKSDSEYEYKTGYVTVVR